MRSIESHDRQIGEVVDGLALRKVRMDTLAANVEALVKISNRDTIDILTLANIAENRENRIERLEDGRGWHRKYQLTLE